MAWSALTRILTSTRLLGGNDSAPLNVPLVELEARTEELRVAPTEVVKTVSGNYVLPEISVCTWVRVIAIGTGGSRVEDVDNVASDGAGAGDVKTVTLRREQLPASLSFTIGQVADIGSPVAATRVTGANFALEALGGGATGGGVNGMNAIGEYGPPGIGGAGGGGGFGEELAYGSNEDGQAGFGFGAGAGGQRGEDGGGSSGGGGGAGGYGTEPAGPVVVSGKGRVGAVIFQWW